MAFDFTHLPGDTDAHAHQAFDVSRGSLDDPLSPLQAQRGSGAARRAQLNGDVIREPREPERHGNSQSSAEPGEDCHEMQVFKFAGNPPGGESVDHDVIEEMEQSNIAVTSGDNRLHSLPSGNGSEEAGTAEAQQPMRDVQGSNDRNRLLLLENGWTNSGYAAENLPPSVDTSSTNLPHSELTNHSALSSPTNQNEAPSATTPPFVGGGSGDGLLPGSTAVYGGNHSNAPSDPQNSLQKRPLTPPDVDSPIQEEETPSTVSEENKDAEEEVTPMTSYFSFRGRPWQRCLVPGVARSCRVSNPLDTRHNFVHRNSNLAPSVKQEHISVLIRA